MSKRHYIPKRALKRVRSTRFQKKPLTYAVALALISGAALPATGWAADTFTITGIKFVDSYPTTPNNVYDPGEGQDSLYKEYAYIYLERVDVQQNPIAVPLKSGSVYTFNNLFPGTYKIWQRIDNQLLEVLGMDLAQIKWSTKETALTVIAVEQNGTISIEVKDGDIPISSGSGTVTVNFPFPDLSENENAGEDNVANYCDQSKIGIVLCGQDATTCPTSSNVIQVTSSTSDVDWDQHGIYATNGISEQIKLASNITTQKSVAIYGTVELPLTDVSSQLNPIIDAFAVCNYGTLVGKATDWWHWYHGYDHPFMPLKFLGFFGNFGTIKAQSSDDMWQTGIDILIQGKDDLGTTDVGVFYNTGLIQAGNATNVQATGGWDGSGGDLTTSTDYPSKWDVEWLFSEGRVTGGSVKIESLEVYQKGTIMGGTGISTSYQDRYHVPLWLWWGMSWWDWNTGQQNGQYFLRAGGTGGNTSILTPISGGSIVVTASSVTTAGRGGDVHLDNNDCPNCNSWEVKGGKGGILIVNASNVTVNNGHYEDNQSATTVLEGNSVYVDPSIMLMGKTPRIKAEEDVVIFGGDNWQLDLSGLSEGAIIAGRNIILAVGEGSTVDLRGVSPKAFKATGKVEIYANNILLDAGVQLGDLIEAQEIVTGTNKIIYRVVLEGGQQVRGKAGETFPVELIVYNGGPKEDSYTLNVEGELSSNVIGLPTTLTVDTFKQTKVKFDVKLPANADTISKVTIKAVSSDSSHGAEATLPVLLVTEPLEKVALTVTKVGEGTVMVQSTECNDSCSEEFDLNSNVKLMATPADGYQFIGWSGDCNSDAVMVTMDAPKNCTATFTAIPVGQYTAHGTLLDKAGKPLANVTVQVGDKTTVTDATGHWEVSGLFEGTYDVFAIKDNFSCSKSDVELGNQEFSAEVNCELVNALKVFVKPQTSGAVKQGDEQTYLITVVNGGQQTASGVTLIETLPEGSELVALEALDGGICDANTLTCTLADLTPGVTARFKLVLRHPTAKTLKNVVTVTSNEYPIEVKTNWQKIKPYLSLTGQSVPNPVEMGKTIHYQLTAELLNNSPQPAAENVIAEITLPTEVKFLGATATQGTCELAGNKVICQLGNLSIANSDDVSRVTIDLDVELADLGLLQLSAETRVYANNLPEHRDVIRTALLLADVQVDGAILLDVTGSMGEELQAVIKAVRQQLTKEYAGGKNPLIALVSFRDSVKLEAVSTDFNVLLKALGKLEAKGGGLCAEASAEALTLALNHVKPGGTIVFASDAPPYDGTDIQALKAGIVAKQAVFIPILTKSDCAANELAQ